MSCDSCMRGSSTTWSKCASVALCFQVKSVFGTKMFALNVVIKVPVPKHTAKATMSVTGGKAK